MRTDYFTIYASSLFKKNNISNIDDTLFTRVDDTIPCFLNVHKRGNFQRDFDRRVQQ